MPMLLMPLMFMSDTKLCLMLVMMMLPKRLEKTLKKVAKKIKTLWKVGMMRVAIIMMVMMKI